MVEKDRNNGVEMEGESAAEEEVATCKREIAGKCTSSYYLVWIEHPIQMNEIRRTNR